jgi:hypothetical protein
VEALILVGAVVAVSALWNGIVGGYRDYRAAKNRSLVGCCHAWRRVGEKLYLCGDTREPGSPWCRRHETEEDRQRDGDHDLEMVPIDRRAPEALAGTIAMTLIALGGVGALAFVLWLGSRYA